MTHESSQPLPVSAVLLFGYEDKSIQSQKTGLLIQTHPIRFSHSHTRAHLLPFARRVCRPGQKQLSCCSLVLLMWVAVSVLSVCVCVWPLLHWWASSPVGPWACACLFSQLVDYIWPKMAMERSWSLQRCPGLLFRPDSCRHSASSSKPFDGSSISFCHGEGSCKIFHVLVLITVWLDLHACSKIIALLMVWFHCWNHFYWWA